jgi:hypothetical protein
MLINRHMGLGLSKSLVTLLQLGLVVSLYACTPQYDWRTVRVEQQAYTALFPAKPQHLERQINYLGTNFNQALEVVKVADTIYSITTIQVPPNLISSARGLIAQLKAALFSQALLDIAQPTAVAGFYQLANSPIRIPTEDYFLMMKPIDGINRVMRVRWVIRNTPGLGLQIYQQSLLMPIPKKSASINSEALLSHLDDDNAAPFFADFHPD